MNNAGLAQNCAQALRLLDSLETKTPNFEPFQNVRSQLAMITELTNGGRVPTDDEKESIDVGLVALREIGPIPTQEAQQLTGLLHKINYAFDKL